jgi:hypothetical protein
VRLERLDQLKNPMTSSGIEPATFLLVAVCSTERDRGKLSNVRRIRENIICITLFGYKAIKCRPSRVKMYMK